MAKELKMEMDIKKVFKQPVPENAPECDAEMVPEKLPAAKKSRTWKEENRKFQEQWETRFLVFLKPSNSISEQVAVCAVCKKEIRQIKMYAMQRHYNTHAGEVEQNYRGEFQRRKLLNDAKTELERQQQPPRDFLKKADQLLVATFKVALLLGQARKSFDEGELVKKIVLAVQPENTLFRELPLSNDMLQRSTRDLANFLQNEIAEKVAASPFYSLCLVESLDVMKYPKIIVCVRFFDCAHCCFTEGVLCQVSLTDRPTGKHIFQSVQARMQECRVSFDNLCGLTADGAAARQGVQAEVLNCFQKSCPQKLFLFHWFVHQEVLASKASMESMDEVESIVKKCISAVNTSGVNKETFTTLCDAGSETHKVLLNYNLVHWLSFNDRVRWLFELRGELIEVLNTISPELSQKLQDPEVHGALLFLKEFLPKLSSLTLELQIPQLTIFDRVEVIHTFRMTIADIVQQLQENQDFSVFSELSGFLGCQDESVQRKVGLAVTKYLRILSEELENCFSEGNFFRQYTFVTDPFSNSGSGFLAADKLTALRDRLASFASLDVRNLQYLLVHMRNNARMKTYFSQPGVTVQQFWLKVYLSEDTYRPLAKVAFLFLSLFSTTVLCERAFSALHCLKGKSQNGLTDANLESSLLVSQETRDPADFPFQELLNFCR
ncbi:zinc finger MYM-type protein 6-like [Malaclemys terrapin pileata]|uniref:zinc finger MYM-type protein 6-like n=1 Tax=Malaclemys terrapin pileata TaxID=2991368 RepID=UPI0023A90980|nr:zinc finger MYM-type protein 6-like [Malaclemys terrapin pileata]XP_053872779.1 zinc finger MYM-type protein 6-like [Malaclemys terrapin pileata]